MQMQIALARGHRVAWRLLAGYRASSRRDAVPGDESPRGEPRRSPSETTRATAGCVDCNDQHPAIIALKRRLVGTAAHIKFV